MNVPFGCKAQTSTTPHSKGEYLRKIDQLNLFIVAHLAQQHSVFSIIDKEIPDLAAMGIMAGDACHFLAAYFFNRIRLALERMPFTGGGSDHMSLFGNVAMTGKTQLVDRLDQLGFILAAVGIMAGFTQSCFDWTMDEFPFFQRLGHVGMALVTECCVPFEHFILGIAVAAVAIAAGIGADRTVHIFYIDQFPVAAETGIALLGIAAHLVCRGLHVVAGRTWPLLFRNMHDVGHKLWWGLALGFGRRVIYLGSGCLYFLPTVEQIDLQLVAPLIPDGLGHEKILKQLAILGTANIYQLTGNAVYSDPYRS